MAILSKPFKKNGGVKKPKLKERNLGGKVSNLM